MPGPGNKEFNAKKVIEEARSLEITKRRLDLMQKVAKLRKGELSDMTEIANLQKDAVRLTDLEAEAREGLTKKFSGFVDKFKSDHAILGKLLGNTVDYVKNEINPLTQIEFLWKRVKNSAEIYAKMQGSLPALTAKQTTEIEKIINKIDAEGMSVSAAWSTFTSLPGIFKDLTESAKTLAYQQFKMAENTKTTALRYGQTYDAVRDIQKTIQLTTAIRVVDDKTRQNVEQLTDSILYLQARGIATTEESLRALPELSRQFGSGMVKDVKKSSEVFERLARIPDKLSDDMEKAEGAVGRFAATNREDFLKTVLEINKAYGSQSTILKNVGATFASLTMEARKYGAQAETADRVARSLSGALLENQEDSHIAYLAGEELANRLKTEPALFTKMTSGMSKEMKDTVQTLVNEGGMGLMDLSKIFASSSEGMVSRINVIKSLYGGQDLAVTARLLEQMPGFEKLKGPEDKLIAARMIKEGKSAEEAAAAIEKLIDVYSKDSSKQRENEAKTLTGVNAIADPLKSAKTAWEGTKEAAFVKATEKTPDISKAISDNVDIAAQATSTTAFAVRGSNIILNKILAKLPAVSGAKGALAASTEMLEGGGKAVSSNILGKASALVMKIPGMDKVMQLQNLVAKLLPSIPGAGMVAKGLKVAPGASMAYDLYSGGFDKVLKQLSDAITEGKEIDVEQLAKSMGRAGVNALMMPALGEFIAGKVTAPLMGMTEEQARAIYKETMGADAIIKKFDEIGQSIGATVGDAAVAIASNEGGGGLTAVANSSPQVIVNNTQAKNITLNPDGSATISTTLELSQRVPGFSNAVGTARAQTDVTKPTGD